ncbi:hypothetical protein T439DRAFT_333920 [Meredithblackwellia eburnea MCA 4105]
MTVRWFDNNSSQDGLHAPELLACLALTFLQNLHVGQRVRTNRFRVLGKSFTRIVNLDADEDEFKEARRWSNGKSPFSFKLARRYTKLHTIPQICNNASESGSRDMNARQKVHAIASRAASVLLLFSLLANNLQTISKQKDKRSMIFSSSYKPSTTSSSSPPQIVHSELTAQFTDGNSTMISSPCVNPDPSSPHTDYSDPISITFSAPSTQNSPLPAPRHNIPEAASSPDPLALDVPLSVEELRRLLTASNEKTRRLEQLIKEVEGTNGEIRRLKRLLKEAESREKRERENDDADEGKGKGKGKRKYKNMKPVTEMD